MNIEANGLGALYAALALARLDFETVVKDKTARIKTEKGDYAYKYADLSAIIEATAGPLAKQGLAVIQEPEVVMEGGRLTIHVNGLIVHKSGAVYPLRPLALPVAQSTAQGIGSAISYARRYQLQAALNLAADDDDAKSAIDSPKVTSGSIPTAKPSTSNAAPSVTLTAEDFAVDPPTPYAAIATEATGKLQEFMDWCYGLHRQNGPCSDDQYRYLAGVINAITGVNASHNAVLAALVRRPVSIEDVPGSNLVSKLLDTLVEHKTVDDVKVANPTYKKPYVNTIKRIYELTREIDGQARLIDDPEPTERLAEIPAIPF